MFMGTLAHVQPRKTLSEKKNPSSGLIFRRSPTTSSELFLLNTKYKIEIQKYPDLGPQIPGFQVRTSRHIQEVPRA